MFQVFGTQNLPLPLVPLPSHLRLLGLSNVMEVVSSPDHADSLTMPSLLSVGVFLAPLNTGSSVTHGVAGVSLVTSELPSVAPAESLSIHSPLLPDPLRNFDSLFDYQSSLISVFCNSVLIYLN